MRCRRKFSMGHWSGRLIRSNVAAISAARSSSNATRIPSYRIRPLHPVGVLAPRQGTVGFEVRTQIIAGAGESRGPITVNYILGPRLASLETEAVQYVEGNGPPFAEHRPAGEIHDRIATRPHPIHIPGGRVRRDPGPQVGEDDRAECVAVGGHAGGPPIVEEKDLGDGTRLVHFAETPRMATYLLAFVIGPLETLDGKTRTGTKVVVRALPDRIAHGRWGLEESIRVLEYLNEYYGVPYPLAKLDHIALQDFAAGAMENWGAITYRERILLFDPATSSAQTRQNIVDVIAHETAHMWFGDLVTMAWWDDLWLNESFATWMGTKTVNSLHPEWKMWTQFFGSDTINGLTLDGLRSSHPIEVDVKDPAEIREIFDEISYSKGASILRMLEQFLGEAAFRRGLRSYLREHSYGTARPEDLGRAAEAASGKPVRAVMGTWTRQTGFPLLDVQVTRKNGAARIALSQSRYLYGHILGQPKERTTWKVPVHVARAGQRKPTIFLMEKPKASQSLGRSRRRPDDDWIKVNAGQSGFYRVNYPAEEWARLRRAVAEKQLDTSDRIGLQNDAYDLTRAGYLPATTCLELTSEYRDEDDVTAWRMIVESLHDFETLISDEPYLTRLDAYGRDLFRPAGKRSGWDPKPGEGHLETLKRTTVLGRLGHYEDRGVLAEASKRFTRSLKDPTSLSPDLRGLVYSLVAQGADPSTYETLWDLEQKAALQEEKVRVLLALTKTRDAGLLQEIGRAHV